LAFSIEFSLPCREETEEEHALKLINGVVAALLLATLLQNRQPYIALAGLVLVLLWALALRLSKGLGFQRLEWAIVICLAYWTASYFWSVGDVHNFISYDFIRRDGALLVSYTAFLGFLGWSLTGRQVRNFWMTFLVLLAFIALPGIAYCLHFFPFPGYIEALGIAGPDPSIGGRMFVGWFEAHNSTGGVYALGSILALSFLQEPGLSPKRRQFIKMIFLCCLGGLLFSFSRGGYLGFMLGAAYLLPLRKLGTTIRAALSIGVPVLLLALFTSTLLNRIDSITDPYYGTAAARLSIWGDALDDIEASPIIGIGFSRFNDDVVDFKGVKGLYWVGVSGTIKNDDSHAHNSYLHFWAEGGIIGLWLTLRVWWCAWVELSFFETKLLKSRLRGLHRSAKACLLGILMLSFTEHMLGKGSVAMVAMSLLGTIIAASRQEWRALAGAEEERIRDHVRRLGGAVRARPEAVAAR
jgi:O-antigen ligase